MNTIKRIGRALLLPHIAIMLLLVPIAAACLIGAMLTFDPESPPAIAAYVLAAYTLTVWCFRIPTIIRFCQHFKAENPYARRWFGDVHLRTSLTLYGSLIWNTAYALFQLWLGIASKSLWFYSMAAYYIFLAMMRFHLASHTRKYTAGEQMHEELKRYRICGWIFLAMNMTLITMIVFMIYLGRTFEHDPITTIALAAYTFTSFTVAIVNNIRYRKYNSPVYSAAKIISLAAACVSMITLTATMLTTFGDGTTDLTFRRSMLGLVGGAVSLFVVGMAIYMIRQSTEKLKLFNTEVPNEA